MGLNWAALAGAVLVGALALMAGPAHAAPIYSITRTFSGTCGNDGPCSATTTIKLQSYSGGTAVFEVDLTDTLKNPTSPGELLSGILISLNQSIPTGSSAVTLASQSGQLIDLASNGSFTDVSGNPTHWGAGRTTSNCAVSGSCIALETAGNAAQGGTPVDMIIGPPNASNLYSNANGGLKNGNFYPYIQGTAIFFVDVSGLTGLLPPQISGIELAFGTSPDYFRKVPEPSSLAMVLAGLGLIGGALYFGRKKAMA